MVGGEQHGHAGQRSRPPKEGVWLVLLHLLTRRREAVVRGYWGQHEYAGKPSQRTQRRSST
jgi:hypothetical protein